MSSTVTTVSHRLVGWGTFDDLRNSILPRVFGHLVVLAAPVVREYQSDLFHDAEWLRENLTGAMTFDFCVRYSGTHLGSIAGHSFASVHYDAAWYRLTLRPAFGPYGDGNADWWLDIETVDTRPARPTED